MTALLVVACSNSGTAQSSSAGVESSTSAPGQGPASTTASTIPSEPTTFKVALVADVTTDNWWAGMGAMGSSSDRTYLGHTKISLFTFTEPGFVYVPAAAATPEPVEPVEEGDIWVVEQPIRRDLRWSDDTPVTANDLVFYFDVVREFELDGMHDRFSPTVRTLIAIDEYTVRVEFSEEPHLAAWHHGVALAPFVSHRFWVDYIKEARRAADEYVAGLTDQEAIENIVQSSLDDADPLNDLTEGEVTPRHIDEWKMDVRARVGRQALYEFGSPMEPSAGPHVFVGWEPGRFVRTVSNPNYWLKGSEIVVRSGGTATIISGGERASYGNDTSDMSGGMVASYLVGPFVDEFLWIEAGSKQEAYQMLADGEVDFALDPDGIRDEERAALATVPNLRFSVSQGEDLQYLAFNLRKSPMSQRPFRRAVATLVDKELVAGEMLDDAVFPAHSLVHPGLLQFHTDDLDRPGWANGAPLSGGDRIETAVQILKEAGYTWRVEPVIDSARADPVIRPGQGLTMPDGEEIPRLRILSLDAAVDEHRAIFAGHVRDKMTEVGIPVEVEASDFDSILSAVFPPQSSETALNWDMYVLGWGAPDIGLPGASLASWFHSREDTVRSGGLNTTGYSNEAFDGLADELATAGSLDAAIELTREMESIISEDLPYIPLFRSGLIEVMRENVAFPASDVMGGYSGPVGAWPGAVRLSGRQP